MAGPWDEFATPTSGGPWESFKTEAPSAPQVHADPQYQSYLDTHAKEKQAYESAIGQIPGGRLYQDPLDYLTWKRTVRDKGKLTAGDIGHAVGTAGDLALSLGAGALDIATLPVGVIKGVAQGRTGKQAAEDWVGKPLYVPKFESSEKALQWVAQNIPAVLPHIPVRATRGQIRSIIEAELRKPKIDFTPEAVTPEAPKPPVDPTAPIDMQGSQAPQYMPGNAPLRVDENGIPYRADVSEALVPRSGDLFGDTPPIPDPIEHTIIQRTAPEAPPMRVTPEGQAFTPGADTAFWQDRAAAMTRAEQDQLAFFRQQALLRQREAQMAEEARGQVPLRAQQTDPFNPYPVAGDAPTMEAMARAQQGVEYAQVPPDAVIPRDAMFLRGERDKPMLRVPRGNEWVVDENGMPVRQGLPESTVAPDYINPYMRQDMPARNDLGNAIQQASGPLLGPDQPFGSENLSGPMGAPALSPLGDIGKTLANEGAAQRSGLGPGKAGPGKGITRGAINPQVFQKGYKKYLDFDDGLRLVFYGHPQDPKVSALRDGKEIAHVRFSRDNYYAEVDPSKDNLQVKWVQTAPEAQRQGIATRMYQFAASLGNDVIPDDVQSAGGKALWDKLVSEGIARENDWEVPHRKIVAQQVNQWAPTPVGQAGLGRGRLTRGAVDLGLVKQAQKRMAEIDDITKKVYSLKPASPQEIIDQSLAAGKDSTGIDILEAGATLAGAKRNSPLIKHVAHTVQYHKAAAERQVKDFVFPYEAAVRKLSRQEVQDLAHVLKQEMLNNTLIPMTRLVEAGFNEKQLLAYQKARDMFERAYQAQNAQLLAAGKKPLTRLEAYLNSQWQGVHRRAIHDKQGRLVWFLAADNLGRLERDTKALLKDHPDLVPQQPFMMQKGFKGVGDIHQIYRTMIEVMGDDPRFQEVKTWYESKLKDEASRAGGQQRFFTPGKAGVRGFVGDRPLTGTRSNFSEALALLQTQANYAKGAFEWSSLQEAGTHLKDVFSNKDLQAQQPNNLGYAKKYFMHQLGANEAAWVKAMEDAINTSLGKYISTDQIGRGINTGKALWITQKLAFNTGYALANVFQLPHALPYLTKLTMEHGGNPITSIATGTSLGTMLVLQHQLNPAKVNLAKMLAGLPKKDGDFFAQAMKYAEDNGVVLSSAADEAPIERSFGALAKAKRVADWTISFPDSLRSIAFMTFASHLHNTGKFDNLTALKMAHDMTVQAMVDFRPGERAMIFEKAGTVGKAANVLQSYAINYLQQWNMWAREAARGNPVPALVALGVQGAIGGAMGVPFFGTIDKTVEFLKDFLRDNAPLAWEKVKDFSLKRIMLEVGGEQLLYGAVSKNPLDISIASRVQAPGIEEMVQVPGAPWADIARQAGSIGEAVTNPTEQNLAQALYNITPTGLQGALETGPLREHISSPRKNEAGEEIGRIVRRPREMSDPEGMFSRTPYDETVRATGLRTQRETFERDLGYMSKKSATDVQSVVAKLPERIWNSARNQDGKLDEYIALYLRLNPGMEPRNMEKVISDMLSKQAIKGATTSTERLIMGKNTLANTIAYKRFKDALERAGYATQP